ncbi:HNH endonuclease [Pseudomonas veronii]|uniref:HNH endonuclease n=1 Tax=Pseudomonas veronii TaxID=76761 RepID=UPI000F817E44|nr:HNH endonuclease [Pseudomonas veronii]RTY61958.1 HNH endonuclease [Pseudomonas veronii]
MTISHEELKSVLAYDADTGQFTWLVNSSARVQAGRSAGYMRKRDGYIVVRVRGHGYSAHRLAWFYTHGVWPVVIDHIDRNRSNNAMENLREATASQNGMNTGIRELNTSGYRGVTWNKAARRWQAQARLNGRNFYLGVFESAVMASEVYEEFCKERHGEFYVGSQGEAA